MVDLQNMIIQGIREAVPQGQNINKAFSEHQGKDESPTDWLERLRKNIQMYSGLDPDTPVGEALLKTQFVAKSWGDIRKKLEKLEDWQERGLQELLREAQKVYVRKDKEKAKAKAKSFVAAVRETQKGGGQSRDSREARRALIIQRQKNAKPDSPVGITCFYCGKKGHMKRDCKKREIDQKLFEDQ